VWISKLVPPLFEIEVLVPCNIDDDTKTLLLSIYFIFSFILSSYFFFALYLLPLSHPSTRLGRREASLRGVLFI
jgi:hypothetical protein